MEDKTLPPSLKEDLCFIEEFTDRYVQCYFFELKELRVFYNMILFQNMKLFVGKNIVFESITEPGTAIMRCKETKSIVLRQLWNYHILGKFNLKNRNIMSSRYRITIIFLRQFGFLAAYVHKSLYIGFLCWTIQIDCSKGRIPFFKYENKFKK